MEHPEGATAGVKVAAGVKVEADGEGASGRAKQPTMAELLCLMLSIQQEMRGRSDELSREVAAAGDDQDSANGRLTARLEAMEKAAQHVYGEVSRLGDQGDGWPPETQQAVQQGGASVRSPPPPVPMSPVTPPPIVIPSPPAAASTSAPGFATSTPSARRHPSSGAASMPPSSSQTTGI